MSSVLSSTAWVSGYRMLRMGIAFGVGILVARYLGPDAYGKLSYSVALIMIFLGVAGPGLKDVVTRRLSRQPDRQADFLWAAFRLMLSMNAILLGLALLTVLLLRPEAPLIWAMTAIIGLGNAFRAFEAFELLFLYRLEMAKTVLVQAASFSFISVSKLLLIYFEAGLLWFSVSVGAELFLTGLGFWWLFRVKQTKDTAISTRYVHAGRRFLLEKSLLKTALPAIGGLAFTVLLFKVDQVMLGWLANDEAVGFYAIAAQFSEYWMHLAAALVISSYPGLLTAAKSSYTKFEQDFTRLIALLFYSGFLIAVPFWFLGEWIITLFLGEAYSSAGHILNIHIWSLFFLFMMEALKKWYVIENRLSTFLKLTFLAVLLNIILNLWLIPTYAGIGAAWATVAAYSAAGFWLLFFFDDARPAGLLLLRGIGLPFGWLKQKMRR
ncbi:MAG: flippase [Cyclonatronaceae bacterium]